jgi:hypothetical protein
MAIVGLLTVRHVAVTMTSHRKIGILRAGDFALQGPTTGAAPADADADVVRLSRKTTWKGEVPGRRRLIP